MLAQARDRLPASGQLPGGLVIQPKVWTGLEVVRLSTGAAAGAEARGSGCLVHSGSEG